MVTGKPQAELLWIIVGKVIVRTLELAESED